MYNSLSKSNFNIKKSNNWSYFLLKTKFCFLPTPHAKFCLNKDMPNYYRFHVNCYLKATSNICTSISPKITLTKEV